MRTKYTPGPWDVAFCATQSHPFRYTVASVQESDEEAQANAQLIAAAPDMAEALLEAVHECRCSLRERESGHLIGCYAPKAIEALTKAGLL